MIWSLPRIKITAEIVLIVRSGFLYITEDKMNSKFYFALCILSIACTAKSRHEFSIWAIVYGSVHKVGDTWEFVSYIDKTYPAFGFFDPTMNVTGSSDFFDMTNRLGYFTHWNQSIVLERRSVLCCWLSRGNDYWEWYSHLYHQYLQRKATDGLCRTNQVWILCRFRDSLMKMQFGKRKKGSMEINATGNIVPISISRLMVFMMDICMQIENILSV